MGIRLTEKKLRDARFRKTEEAIFRAFFVENENKKLKASKIAKIVGVSRATFYRHHRAVCEIIEDYERYILEKYSKLIDEIRLRGDTNLRQMYYRMLIFILQNQKIFGVLVEKKNLRLVGEMIAILRPELETEVRLPSSLERIFRVYIGEIVGLINDWGLGGFKETEMVRLLSDMMYLTKTMRNRLLPLVD